jgi:uncharacterized protein YaeQ
MDRQVASGRASGAPCYSRGFVPLHDAMALKATIFKAELGVADLDRPYYGDHVLTVARHPSETDERMLVRLVAFALHADDALAFGRGLSTDDEPALWRKDLTGAIQTWIDVGLPDEKWVRKAAGRARQVFVYCYGGRAAELWWSQNRAALERVRNLTVTDLRPGGSEPLARLAARNMRLQVTVQEGQVWITDGSTTVAIQLAVLKTADQA